MRVRKPETPEQVEKRRARVREYQRWWRKTEAGKAYYHAYHRSEECKQQKRRAELKGTYGLTVEGYEAILAQQGGGCAICGAGHEGPRRLAVDHNHKTKRVRGILCAKHNVAIAVLESPEFAKLVEYLRKHNHLDGIP